MTMSSHLRSMLGLGLAAGLFALTSAADANERIGIDFGNGEVINYGLLGKSSNGKQHRFKVEIQGMTTGADWDRSGQNMTTGADWDVRGSGFAIDIEGCPFQDISDTKYLMAAQRDGSEVELSGGGKAMDGRITNVNALSGDQCGVVEFGFQEKSGFGLF
ncbi:MAG: hypothetical protein ACFB3T_13460 [Geminicoccaceae bacterium]